MFAAEDQTPQRWRSYLAQMSVNTMKGVNVCIGQPVLITSSAGRQEVCVSHINLNELISRAFFMHTRVSLYVFVLQVCVAWPACQFPARRVGLQSSVQLNLRVKPGGHVTLEPINGALLPAEHIRLSLTYSPHHLFSITYSIGWINTQISNLIFFHSSKLLVFKGELKILPWITFILSR